jgi:hypothetical protein
MALFACRRVSIASRCAAHFGAGVRRKATEAGLDSNAVRQAKESLEKHPEVRQVPCCRRRIVASAVYSSARERAWVIYSMAHMAQHHTILKDIHRCKTAWLCFIGVFHIRGTGYPGNVAWYAASQFAELLVDSLGAVQRRELVRQVIKADGNVAVWPHVTASETMPEAMCDECCPSLTRVPL